MKQCKMIKTRKRNLKLIIMILMTVLNQIVRKFNVVIVGALIALDKKVELIFILYIIIGVRYIDYNYY